MARICVSTFASTTDNYGQVLQYLATQEYLKQRGHDPYLLRSKGHKKNLFEKIFKHLLWRWHQIYPKKLTEKEQQENKIYEKWFGSSQQLENEHPRFFEEFRKRNFKILDIYNEDVSKWQFDAYCVGSDQTWASSDPNNFFKFVGKGTLKFAIAPSIAHYIFSDFDIEKLRKYVMDFAFITVREENGINFCNQIGYKGAKKILDPTFLISTTTYDLFIPQSISERQPYILLYLLGNDIQPSVEEIIRFAKRQNLDILYVASQGRNDQYPKIYPEIGEWLQLIKEARYVITNSFHGMAFCILYKKQFLVLPAIGFFEGMNNRIYSLAESFSLNDRIYKDNFETINNPIDWSKTELVISQNRKTLDSLMISVNL